MSNQLAASLISLAGVVLAAGVGWISSRMTAAAADRAAKRQQLIEADKNIIESTHNDLDGLRELAEQGRADREEMRRERAEMERRIKSLESEVRSLRGRVTELESRNNDLQQDKTRLTRYIDQLREMLTNLGHKPPRPDFPFGDKAQEAGS